MKIVNISGVIGYEVEARDVREALQAAGGEEVEVHISSPGGLISVGLEIFNLLRDYNGPINCVLKGYAMSMGSYIPLAIPLNRFQPGKIKAEDNAIYMIHNARGWVVGDHNEILGYGEALKGMSNMIAKAYARRTGKTVEDCCAMMDRTTYMYGDQIKEHGFADEILEVSDPDNDEESARAQAQASFDGMVARMVADQAKMRADLQAVAQMLGEAPTAQPEAVQPPAAAGISTKEDQQMNLAQLLAANPAAKIEYDAALVQARDDGEKAGKKEVEMRITAATPYLNNETYPAAVGQTAVKLLKGECNADTLLAVVTAVDAVREQAASTAAQTATATTPATPAAQVTVPAAAQGGAVSTAEGLEELKALDKGGN